MGNCVCPVPRFGVPKSTGRGGHRQECSPQRALLLLLAQGVLLLALLLDQPPAAERLQAKRSAGGLIMGALHLAKRRAPMLQPTCVCARELRCHAQGQPPPTVATRSHGPRRGIVASCLGNEQDQPCQGEERQEGEEALPVSAGRFEGTSESSQHTPNPARTRPTPTARDLARSCHQPCEVVQMVPSKIFDLP